MKKSIAISLLLAVISVYSAFAGEIVWENSLRRGEVVAKEENKPVMADFYTDWCGWCTKLDQDTYSNPKVQELATNFVCVKVDGDKYPADVKKYSISGYPTIVFLDSTGKEIDRNVGYAGPEEFTNLMQKVLKK